MFQHLPLAQPAVKGRDAHGCGCLRRGCSGDGAREEGSKLNAMRRLDAVVDRERRSPQMLLRCGSTPVPQLLLSPCVRCCCRKEDELRESSCSRKRQTFHKGRKQEMDDWLSLNEASEREERKTSGEKCTSTSSEKKKKKLIIITVFRRRFRRISLQNKANILA